MLRVPAWRCLREPETLAGEVQTAFAALTGADSSATPSHEVRAFLHRPSCEVDGEPAHFVEVGPACRLRSGDCGTENTSVWPSDRTVIVAVDFGPELISTVSVWPAEFLPGLIGLQPYTCRSPFWTSGKLVEFAAPADWVAVPLGVLKTVPSSARRIRRMSG